MTIDEFVDELAHVSDQFRWSLIPHEGREAERRGEARSWLRGTPLAGPDQDQALDPITALCYARTGTRQPWLRSMEVLALSPTVAEQLIAASADRTWTTRAPGQRQPEKDLLALRARLTKAVGLSAPTPAEALRHLFSK